MNMNEPKLRFKADDGSQFPDWERKCLSDIASFHSGLTYTPDDVVDSENGILVFRSSNIQNGRISYNDNVYVDKELKERNYVKLHDIVVCVRNGSKALVGKNALVTESDLNATWGAFMTVIRAKQNYEFVHQYLNSTFFKKEMYKDSGTATINQITTAMLNDCKLFVPSLPEQQKIAEFLSTIDTVIAKQKETVSAWEERKKGMMQKLFSQEVRFKADDGSNFPEWEEKKLGDISERILVGLATTVTPYYREKGRPMFRNLNIKQGYLDDRDMLFLDDDYADSQKNKAIHFGDILTVHTGNIGWSCLVPEKYEGALSFTTLITTVKFNVVSNKYVCDFLNSPLGMNRMQNLAFSGGRANLNTSEFQKVQVPVPCLAEQQKIADCLSSLDEVIEKKKATLDAWEELKKGLLQQMFV